MLKSKKYFVSLEVYKYPYCGRNDETEDYFSEKICYSTIRICKKISKKTKRLIVYVDLILRLTNGVVPSQAIGLPILPTAPPVHSNVGFSKKEIISQVIKEMPAEIGFTEREMDQLYHLSIECRNNSLSQEELITKIRNLRG